MYCPKCGTENDDNNYRCLECGGPLHRQAPVPVEVPGYLVHAVLCTLFCCMPFGIVAIVYAAQTTSRAQVGDLAGAQYNSERARMWCWVSFWLGLIPAVIGLFFFLIGGAMGAIH